MIGTMYSHQLAFETIEQVIKSNLPKAKLAFRQEGEYKIIQVEYKKGIFSSAVKFSFNYKERNDPNSNLDQAQNCKFSDNLKGLHGYVSGINAANEKSKQLFLLKIKTLNCAFSIMQEQGEIHNIQNIIKELAEKLDAILFVQPDSIISQDSRMQHFLNHDLKLVLNQAGESKVDFYGEEIEAQYQEIENQYQEYINKIPQEQRTRKLINEKFISEQGIKVNKFLPPTESEESTKIREPKEIAERVTVLAIINGFTSNFLTSERTIDMLKAKELWEAVTPKEKDLLQNPTEEKKTRETWKCEGIWTLLWALKAHDDLGKPSDLCDLGNIAKEKYPLTNPTEFISNTTESRSKKEILNIADLYYRLDWACVDMRIKGLNMSQLNQSVVYERHYALNWLINYSGQDWDEISCDT